MTEALTTLLPNLGLRLQFAQPRPMRGTLRSIRGVLLRASVAGVGIGELCVLRDPGNGRELSAEVIGFDEDDAILSPIGSMEGLSTRTQIIATGQALGVQVGDALLGRVISPMGEFLDGPAPTATLGMQHYPLHAEPPAPFSRQRIVKPLSLGIRAIDSLLTLGQGQRMGIFGEPGVGKSSLLASIVRNSDADVIVIGLIGERGREVRELLEGQLDATARARTVAVVATSDRPAAERVRAAYVATTLAEYHRDQGRNVLLLMDSLTRFARAQREIGLAVGEPPTRRGYPPSFFSALPRLLERAGPGPQGSITALYTVLTEGDAAMDPVAEETRSILDGHIVLSAELAQRDHFPAIDVLRSRSRLMDHIATAEHRQLASRLRELIARRQEIELLIQVGEYAAGSDPIADEAIARHSPIEAFLRQPPSEHDSLAQTLARLRKVLA
ncbi:ATP synthase [Pseudomonas amygdali pv. tabaci str. ATCC 11528]|uniref:protein-secreting ATPase n=4 Tax=Pseudomonas syringae group TaxID=136849 RepID=A0AB37R327_PSEAV|nr:MULTISPECIES: FliI/YscN family ATPase [Pseudomonas]KPW39971.1 Type III secretion component [Pseudomonas amygdali]ARA81132.1 flagellum-specific ATP synthase FliI [Pseudomonas amygdali pv. lachrymans]AXH56622.1 FliI/YscN family ATPase [Pseudomonas amygdali pv. lachrymans str. M301315]KKY50998.1 ATP synthase [Pseudomonas amygdali pv. tabaci str. ATCC 11528]KKY58451.1 ATP synthase [Pseudomonas amygdali pv. lachrymans]